MPFSFCGNDEQKNQQDQPNFNQPDQPMCVCYGQIKKLWTRFELGTWIMKKVVNKSF